MKSLLVFATLLLSSYGAQCQLLPVGSWCLIDTWQVFRIEVNQDSTMIAEGPYDQLDDTVSIRYSRVGARNNMTYYADSSQFEIMLSAGNRKFLFSRSTFDSLRHLPPISTMRSAIVRHLVQAIDSSTDGIVTALSKDSVLGRMGKTALLQTCRAITLRVARIQAVLHGCSPTFMGRTLLETFKKDNVYPYLLDPNHDQQEQQKQNGASGL